MVLCFHKVCQNQLTQLCMTEHVIIIINKEFVFIFGQTLHHVFLTFSISWLQRFKRFNNELSLGLGKILRMTLEKEFSGENSEDRMSRTLPVCLE